MFEILKSLTFKDLPTKPEIVGKPKLSEDLQQTVALLVGWDKSTRRLVSVSPTGVLHVTSSPVKGIINTAAATPVFDYQGEDVSTSEVMIRANPFNAGMIWVNVGAVGADDVGYPLDAGEWVRFSINNLHSLHVHFDTDLDKAIIVYSK